MANQSESTTVLKETTKVEIDYIKILQHRKAISEEDNLTMKRNVLLAQAYKSNWKLNAQDERIADELNVYQETFNNETTSIESCIEQNKYFKQENKQIFEERKDKIQEKVLHFEEKFLNSYNEYESKNLIANIQEYRDKIREKLQDLNNVKQVEGNWREKVGAILENLGHEKVFTFLNDVICTEDRETIEESLILKRILKASKFKCQQHEETIKEFLIQK